MAGRTDPEIGLETLALNGVEEGEAVWPRFAAALAAALAERAEAMRADGRACPGAREALSALAGVDGVIQSVLTGSLQPNVAIKLGAFGLERTSTWRSGRTGRTTGAARCSRRCAGALRCGARGRAGGNRPRRGHAARRRGGDAADARVVAVATGPRGREELAATGAVPALDDLRDTDAVLDAVLGRETVAP